MSESKYIKICTNCGSIDITIPPAGTDIKLTFPDYCKDCKNKGIFPEVKIEDINKFKKKLK